ncbi:MAG TPA: glycosyl hydrolase family 28-related protein, partial [Verrucomicrobiae bacterium]|nr:glycosyl hydrolase family 28-related protein [Verrucomicrobiae bacterium]
MNKYFIIIALLGMAPRAFSQAGQRSPRLFQVTTAETRPGEAVLVRGEDLDLVREIDICRLPDEVVDQGGPSYVPLPKEDALYEQGGTAEKVVGLQTGGIVTVDRLMQNRQSVKFIVPAGWQEGVYSVRLAGKGGDAPVFYINEPKVNWAVSEQGQVAVTGGYLRIQGKNLRREGVKGQVALVPEATGGGRDAHAGDGIIHIPVAKIFDDYSVSVDIPVGTPTGGYYLYYHNGRGGRTAWSEPLRIDVVAARPEKWEAHTYNVQDFGAKGDGEANETAAFRAALDAAARDGGGVVHVPRGRYMLTGGLIIPPYTLLKGESKALTQLFWNPLHWDTGEMPPSLITGTHDFGVEDLVMWASRAWGVIMQDGPVEQQGHVTLQNLIVRQSGQLSGMVYQVKANRDIVDSEFNSKWTRTG